MKYPDTGAATHYPLAEALFTGDPNSYLSAGFTDTGRGLGGTLTAGGSAFATIWDSAHAVWKLRRTTDGAPMLPWDSSGAADWLQPYMEFVGLTPFADAENVAVIQAIIGAPTGAASISDFSSATPNIIGGGLSFANASGPVMATFASAAAIATSGARNTGTEGVAIDFNVIPRDGSIQYAHTRIQVYGITAAGQRSAPAAFRNASSALTVLDATNTDAYYMFGILKIGSATGQAFEYSHGTRMTNRGPLA